MNLVLGGNMEIIALVVTLMTLTLTIEAQQFSLVHKYAHLEGSPANSQGQGASPEYSALLRAHDRRRLAAYFPLGGDWDPSIAGLYYTQLTIGTPPQQYYVQVDTGSDVLWLNCAPCLNCSLTTNLPNITLQLYDPTMSSTDTALGCTDANCGVASYGNPGQCTLTPPGACAYSILYGDGSSTEGYIVNDVLTFQDSATTTAAANIYFGCGTNQTGNLLSTTFAVDGLIGFGQAAISVPTQLADQNKVARVFAHCLQGATLGGGNLVIGNITEPGISYTPMVPNQTHYNVGLQNIAVSGVNITDPTSFAITATNDGVIMDSGTTLAALIQPAYDQFVAAIESGAPVPSQQVSDGNGGYVLCWIYSGDIATTFPPVTLFFDGGAIMNLTPTNYLYLQALTSGSAYCMGWSPTTGTRSAPGVTIFGDIVMKDQLIVYDNSNQILGWKPFDCTQPIPVV